MKHRHRLTRIWCPARCMVDFPGGGQCDQDVTIACVRPEGGRLLLCAGYCAYHDPRRKPTPAEREERRVLLKAAWGHNLSSDFVGDCPVCAWGDATGTCTDAESAAYAWSSGPRR